MDRLTINDDGKYVMCNIDDVCNGMCGSCKRNTQIRQKLREYENLEEKGLLLKLPCKVGDKVFELSGIEIFPVEVESIEVKENFVDFHGKGEMFPDDTYPTMFSTFDVGKSVFLTREQAEQALERMSEKC